MCDTHVWEKKTWEKVVFVFMLWKMVKVVWILAFLLGVCSI